MSDVHNKAERSYNMSRIRGSGNASTELRFIGAMRSANITGWRRKYKLFGSPDFVFPKRRLAIFVDGCFWHGCPMHSTVPMNNQPFWKRKLEANKRRDRVVDRVLRAKGWRVFRVWEHELSRKNKAKLFRRITSISLRITAASGRQKNDPCRFI
jgi:DNA mismatch endonuclease (patch repair protein)